MKKKPANLSDLITATEAARLRGTSRASIHELVQRGRLRSEKLFGRVLLYRKEVEHFEREKPGPKLKGDGLNSRRVGSKKGNKT